MVAACQFPDAQLHAFEPEARNFALLSTNLASLPKATCFREAVGRSAGEVALHLGTSEATHSIVDGFPDAESGPVEMVPVTTLAAHMEAQGLRRIDLLKLDVEGAELDALVGLDARIADVRVIVGELHEHVVDATEFYTFLKDAGFRIVARTAFREGNVTGVHGFEAARKF